jgi:hypothetical protein
MGGALPGMFDPLPRLAFGILPVGAGLSLAFAETNDPRQNR